jgi:hypothetical protein
VPIFLFAAALMVRLSGRFVAESNHREVAVVV